MVSLTRSGKLLLVAALSMVLFTLPTPSQAAEEGTLTVEQQNTEYIGVKRLGEWGLASSTGIVESSDENYSKTRTAGNFALTVKPPDGAVPTIEVYEKGELVETFDSRTANGKLFSGSTLKFVLKYAFTKVGDVSVNSTPVGLNFEMKGPAGTLHGQTPEVYPARVEGTYTVYYKLPSGCRPAPPLSRKLEASDSKRARIGFDFESKCDVLGTLPPKAPTKEEPPKENPEPPAPPPKRSTQSPVRVSLTSGSAEVTAGGTARFTVVVLNRGDSALSNLQVETRYNPGQLTVSGANDAQKSNGRILWTIPSLPAGGKWQTNFSGTAAPTIGNGDVVVASATVTGDEIDSYRSSQRSDSVQIGALKVLPPTGAPLGYLYTLLELFAAAVLSLVLAASVYGWGRIHVQI